MSFIGAAIGIGSAAVNAVGAVGSVAGGVASTVGGGNALAGSATLAGLGLSAYSAFGSKSSIGSGYSDKVNLTPEGTKLQKSLNLNAHSLFNRGLIKDSITSPYIGMAKQAEGQRNRAAQANLAAASTTNPSGASRLAFMGEVGERVKGLQIPAQIKADMRSQGVETGMAGLKNIRNNELQTPLLATASAGYKNMAETLNKARQGQALGDAAQMAGMIAFRPR